MADLNQAAAWLARAEDLLTRRELAGAAEAFNRAEAHGASADRCSAGRWLAAMLRGEFEEAWRDSDVIRGRGGKDPHRFWQGEEISGKRVIVRCLHGFGDAVQMLRYAPMMAETAASVVFEVPPRLLSLAPYFKEVQQVITWGENAPVQAPAWDVQVEVMELPYLFRTVMKDLPLAYRYLKLPESLIAGASLAMGAKERLRVGLVWAGGGWNPARSIPLELLKALAREEPFEFWNLQGGLSVSQADGWRMCDAHAVTGDGITALAATIANLDLVITVDTLAAHLAGALGKPAWVMLQYAADWRWLVEREDSPWYPSLRLFRQTTTGDWAGVVARVREALALLA